MDTKQKQSLLELLPSILEQFRAEGDRGLVLVVATMVERELEKQIGLRLLPKVESTDELMSQSIVSPISSYSAKINLAYRIGVITEPERSIFHQLCAIRNRCAHEIDSQTFDANHFRSRVKNIVDLSPVLWNAMRDKIKPPPFDSRTFETVDEYLDTVGWRSLFELFFAMIVAHKRTSDTRILRITSLAIGG